MSPREELDHHFAAVHRLLALIEHHEIVRKFKADWTVSYTAGERFEDQVDRVKESLEALQERGA